MTTERHRSRRTRWLHQSGAALILVVGCNGLLDNDPRDLDEQTGGSAGSSHTGGSAGTPASGSGGLSTSGGTEVGGSAGATGGANVSGGEGGAAGGGAGGGGDGASGGGPSAGATNGGAGGGDAGAAGAAGAPPCGECSPGSVDVKSQPCACNRGTQTQTRTCDAKCTWGAWSAFGACSVVPECQPGMAAQTQTVDCETCKTKGQSRSCTNTCTWGAWTDTSGCPSVDDCDYCASVEWCTDPNTGGTTCLQEGCTREQSLRDCKLDIVVVCGVTKQPFTMKYK